jgi:hypothetical protein
VENCVLGNSSTIVKKTWGWADADCNTQLVSICKFQREQQRNCANEIRHSTSLLIEDLPGMSHGDAPPRPVATSEGVGCSLPARECAAMLTAPLPPGFTAAPRTFRYERNASAESASSRRRLLELGSSPEARATDVTSPAAAGAGVVLAQEEAGDATSSAAAPGRRLLQEDLVLPDATYILNQKYMTQAEGEKYCVDQGGHLVSYLSLEEQVDVEQYFVGKGWLYSNFNKVYWIGLQVGSRLG